jgi:hypothetical protein
MPSGPGWVKPRQPICATKEIVTQISSRRFCYILSFDTMAKPTTYTQEIADQICERLATSELGLEDVLEEIRLKTGYAPDPSTVWYWRKKHPEFREQESDARHRQAQLLHDRAQKYAREPLIGRIERTITKADGSEETTVTVADNVERSKLLVQTTLRRAGQLDGQRYGDKMDVSLGGEVAVKRVITDI